MKDETWYTREESETSEKYGCIPEKRPVKELLEKGFVIVDKPFGPTSNQISYWVKEELDLRKTGHFGTLDPNATGVLPIGLNRGTRINPILSKTDKEYIFEAELSEEKSFGDVEKALQSFNGVNEQVPPEKSAVKKEEREREVYELELLETENEKILGRVKCESGFYVRVLIEQLSKELDVEAEMTELRRTNQGILEEEDANTLQEIVDDYHFYKEEEDKEKIREVVHPVAKAIGGLRKIAIKDSAVNAVANGANLGSQGISKLQDNISEGETVAITTLKGELVALGTAKMSSQDMYVEDDTAATLQHVYMDSDKYPKRWKQ